MIHVTSHQLECLSANGMPFGKMRRCKVIAYRFLTRFSILLHKHEHLHPTSQRPAPLPTPCAVAAVHLQSTTLEQKNSIGECRQCLFRECHTNTLPRPDSHKPINFNRTRLSILSLHRITTIITQPHAKTLFMHFGPSTQMDIHSHHFTRMGQPLYHGMEEWLAHSHLQGHHAESL